MKNISTILSILALTISSVLLVLYLKDNKKQSVNPATQNTDSAGNEFKIAYFDIDSLQTHYSYFNDVSEQIRQKENAVTNELAGLQSRFQKKIADWQQKIQSNTMTQAEGEQAEREYARMQQEYEQKQISLNQDLQKFRMEKLTEIRNRIETFLTEYNKEKNYAFILSYEPGFMLYYKDTAYDVTKDVIEGLNRQYKQEKK